MYINGAYGLDFVHEFVFPPYQPLRIQRHLLAVPIAPKMLIRKFVERALFFIRIARAARGIDRTFAEIRVDGEEGVNELFSDWNSCDTSSIHSNICLGSNDTNICERKREREIESHEEDEECEIEGSVKSNNENTRKKDSNLFENIHLHNEMLCYVRCDARVCVCLRGSWHEINVKLSIVTVN